MSRDVAYTRYLNMLKTAFGPEIMQFMDDEQVIEVMLNPNGELLVERLRTGKELTGIQIPTHQSENIIKLVASFKNRIADEDSPEVSTDIPFHGARFQGWLPPVVARPTFAIRKKAVNIFTLDDYLAAGSISEKVMRMLKKAVEDRENIIVVGGTGSGKTTFSNALLAHLQGTDERILVLEDLPELQLQADDVVFMSSTVSVSMRDLVKGSLRMRPDRIIIGEVRDGAALDLLKAWNTGHPGGICTIHANSVESTPFRLEDLIQEVVVTVPRNLILQAVDLIVFIERDKAGNRKLEKIARLVGFDKERQEYQWDWLTENLKI